MEFFRSFVIGTLHFVAVIAYFAAIVFGAWTGYEDGARLAADAARETGATAATGLPAWAYAVIGGIAGWLYASVVLGILFILLDIQDGVRDIHRDMVAAKDTLAANT